MWGTLENLNIVQGAGQGQSSAILTVTPQNIAAGQPALHSQQLTGKVTRMKTTARPIVDGFQQWPWGPREEDLWQGHCSHLLGTSDD